MQSSKRTLRSNEVELPPNALLDTELKLTFSLQYPHFLKREGNQLHVMLQRRKRYKNRTILGFKTLATGTINMSQVLQKQMDLELELHSDSKEQSKSGLASSSTSSVMAKVLMLSLSSQPVDAEERSKGSSQLVDGESEEDEEFSSGDEASDSETLADLENLPVPTTTASTSSTVVGQMTTSSKSARRTLATRKVGRGSKASPSAAARQRNLKQKFVALLKKFKVNDPDVLEHERASLDQKLSEGTVDPEEIEDLFDQLQDLSDSEPEVDTISIVSEAKPALEPFFCSTKNLLLHQDGTTTTTASLAKRQDASLGVVTSDRGSEESSKDGCNSDSPLHTEPELSDPPVAVGSPPHSGDEVAVTSRPNKIGGRGRKDRAAVVVSAPAWPAQSGTAWISNPTKTTQSIKSGVSSRLIGDSHNLASGIDQGRLQGRTADESNDQPRKVLLEQLSRLLPAPSSHDCVPLTRLPSELILANTCDGQGAHVAAKLAEFGRQVICTAGPADVRAALTSLTAHIEWYCRTNTQPPMWVRVGLVGSDAFINWILRPYVELFSSRPPDWQGYVRFFIIPLGPSSVARFIGSRDASYAELFVHDSWRQMVEKAEPSRTEVGAMVARIALYLDDNNEGRNANSDNSNSTNENVVRLPIAEAMVTYKERSADEESKQIFVPFVSDVTVTSDSSNYVVSNFGLIDVGDDSPSNIIDYTDRSNNSRQLTPPASPLVAKERPDVTVADPIELQLDFWTTASSTSSRDARGLSTEPGSINTRVETIEPGLKTSVKASIRHMLIQQQIPSDDGHCNTFALQYWIKEKKPKAVMRLGKKKESSSEVKTKRSHHQTAEGIVRLICLSAKSSAPIKVSIDGMEWRGVKFFQLSSQWQTHVKHLPIANMAP